MVCVNPTVSLVIFETNVHFRAVTRLVTILLTKPGFVRR